MKAEEARAMAQKCYSINKILSDIKRLATDGYFEIYYHAVLEEDVIEKLESYGYEVSSRDDTDTYIFWKSLNKNNKVNKVKVKSHVKK